MAEFLESIDWVFEFLYLRRFSARCQICGDYTATINVHVPLRQAGEPKLLPCLLILHRPLALTVGMPGRTTRTSSEARIRGIVPMLLQPGQTLLHQTVNTETYPLARN